MAKVKLPPMQTASFYHGKDAEAFRDRLEAEGFHATVSESKRGGFWVRYRSRLGCEVGTDTLPPNITRYELRLTVDVSDVGVNPIDRDDIEMAIQKAIMQDDPETALREYGVAALAVTLTSKKELP